MVKNLDERIHRLAEIRELYALAVLSGEGDAARLFEDMRELSIELDRLRAAKALRAYRDGEPTWVWPSKAP